jgi:hypothetical protein
MFSSNYKVNLELKSKFFKDTLLQELKNNSIEILNKKIVPHYKTRFIIKLTINFSDAKKVKTIIQSIETTEKENYDNHVKEQRSLLS